MNFSQLQCFVALVETGSFTEAAYTLDLTQSTVSHALAALESKLGVTLLERNRKGGGSTHQYRAEDHSTRTRTPGTS